MEIKDIAEELRELLEGIEPVNEESIDEKIMSKRKARRLKRKRAAAEKKAQEQKAQPKDDAIEAELVDDGGSGSDDNGGDDNKDSNEDGDKDFKALIVYDKKYATVQEEQPTDYSESFKKVIGLINEILTKYGPMFEKANETWKNAGKNKACPPDAFKLFNDAIEGCQKEFNELADNLPDDMYDEEYNYIEMQLEAANKFLEDYGKAIKALHPEEIENLPDNIQDEVDKATDVATTDDEKTGTDVSKKDDKFKTTAHKNEKGKDLITYEEFGKSVDKLNKVWRGMTEAEKELSQTSWPEFIKKLNPVDWFEDRIWSFITSRVVNDLIKTLMYSNPITAMIYDGDIIDFGIKNGLQKLKQQREKQKAARDKKKAEKEKKKEFYDNRHLPKDLSKLTLDELKAEFYGNNVFVALVNAAYNHPDTGEDDSVAIETYVNNIEQGFKSGAREHVIKNFTYLIKKLNEVADYHEWNTPKDFEQMQIDTRDQKTKDKKAAKIKNYKDSTQGQKKTDNSTEIQSAIKTARSILTQNNNKPSKQDVVKAVKTAHKEFKDNEIEAEYDSLYSQNTSYIPEIVSSLIQLCEEAEA